MTRCLEIRRRHVEPLLADGATAEADQRMLDERAFVVRWRFAQGSLALAANFGGPAGLALPTLDDCRPIFRPVHGDEAPLPAPLASWDLVLHG